MVVEHVEWQTGTGITLSENNKKAVVTSHLYTAKANIGRNSGKYYYEITYNTTSSSNVLAVGIVNSNASLTTYDISSNNQRGYYASNGNKFPENIAYGSSYSSGDVIGVLLDFDSDVIKFYKNGASQGASHTNLNSMGTVFPSLKSAGTNVSVTATANFGDAEFKYLPSDLPKDVLAYNGRSLFTLRENLLQSNNKIYSLETINTVFETQMTSNTAPAPLVASASSEYNTTYQAWKAFNGTNTANTDCWMTANNITTGWIQLDFGQSFIFNILKLTSRATGRPSTPSASPKNFNILGSNNGVDYTVLDTVVNQINWTTNETREYHFNNEKNYRFYRVEILENAGYASYSAIAKIEFGYEGSNMYQLPSLSVHNFINYGMSSTVKVDGNFVHKKYITQDANEQGLYTTKTNKKPKTIKIN